MTIPFTRSRIATAVGLIAIAFGAGQAFAAGFALQEQSGSGLGDAYAGGAAAAEDAATVWTNPAGMSKIKTNQVVAAINYVQPSMKFSNGTSLPAGCYPPACAAPACCSRWAATAAMPAAATGSPISILWCRSTRSGRLAWA